VNLPIRIRMTVWYVALLAVIILAIGAFLVLRLRADLTEGIDRSLRPAAEQVARDYHLEGAREMSDSASQVLKGERPAAQVLAPTGGVLAAHGDAVAMTPMLAAGHLPAVLRGEMLIESARLGRSGQRFRVVARRVVRKRKPQVLVAAVSLGPVDRSVDRVLLLLLLAGPAALLATAAGGWWLARRALLPIDRITTTAAGIGPQQMTERIAVTDTADEVGRLARTLNTMLDRIERGVAEQHRLVADASHELRTPLAAMRSEIDVSLRTDELDPAARSVLESAREEVDRMSRTVVDLLTLAIADEGRLDLVIGGVDLQDVAARALAGLEPVARRDGVALKLAGTPVPVAADAERLAQAVRNLAENAIAFSPVGGVVEVATWESDGQAGVSVADAGPGIAPALRERVFDRFFRIDAARTRGRRGSGLGLSITREIVAAHGGRTWVEGRAPKGSVFGLALPVAGRGEAAAPAAPAGEERRARAGLPAGTQAP
jgi:heavy metal sensor kinase